MNRAVPRLLQVPSTRAILLRLFLFLIVVRCASHLPLGADLPDLGPTFHTDPFLALLDIFSGGALARGSAFALGVYPFLLGRLAARLLLPRQASALGSIQFQKLSYRLTLVTAIAMASAYPLFFNHLAGRHDIPWDPFVVLTLATGAMLTLWLGHQLDDDYYWPEERLWGLRLLVAIHVLATLPEYLLWGSPSMGVRCMRVVIVAVAASFYLWISSLERRFPIGYAPRPSQKEGRYKTSIHLPFALNSSRVAPLLWLLAVFGAIQFFSSYLLRSEAGWVRDLAAVEQTLTNLRNPASWLVFFWLGLLIKVAYAMAVMSPFEVSANLTREGAFIPGIRNGTPTGQYLFKTLSRTVWIEPLVTIGMLLVVTELGQRLRAGISQSFQIRNSWGLEAGSFWPGFLIPVLFLTHPLAELRLSFESLLARQNYEGFMKRGRIRGGHHA